MRLQDGHPAGEPEPTLRFDPTQVPYGAADLPRPAFLAIVSAASLAAMLVRRSNGRVDGFVVEGPSAEHNAPPRGQLVLDASGQPVYGQRDLADVGRMKALGLPFWLAGSTGSAEALGRRPGRRRQRNPGGHAVRVFPRVRHGAWASPAGDRGGAPRCRRGSHRCPQLLHRIPLQGGAARRHRRAPRDLRRPAKSLRQRLPARAGGRLAADGWPTGAPPSPLTPTWPRVGPWPTPSSAAACATACSRPPASPRCRRTARWSPRS